MSQGLPTTEETLASDAEGNEYSAINPPVKNKKKTLQQRRKQKEQIKLQKALQKAKREKRKISDIYKLRFIKKQIDVNEKKTKMLQKKREKVEEYKRKEAKRLNSVKFEEQDLDFTVGHELAGNLRNLKKEGNLLLDRFKSLQKRNILEPRVRQTRKRPKTKKYVKPGYKEDWEKTIAR